MKKRSISLIIGLMTLALFGVMAMQYYFIRESYTQKAQLLDLSINSSLSEVANKLVKQDAKRFVNLKAIEEEKQKKKQELEQERRAAKLQAEQYAARIRTIHERIENDFKVRDSILRSRYPRIMTIDNDFYETYFRDPHQLNKVRLQVKLRQSIDKYGQVIQDEIHELYVEDGAAPKARRRDRPVRDSIHYLVEDPANGVRVISVPRVNPRLKKELEEEQERQTAEKLAFQQEQRRRDIHKVRNFLDSVKTKNPKTEIFLDIANEYEHFDIPLLQRISPVDTLLRTELENHGIHLPYNFKISLANSDSVIFSQVFTKSGQPVLSENTYSIALFPKEVVNQSGILTVDFPTKNRYMFQNMYSVLISSAGLLIILIGCFAYTIYIIFRQKKISEIKTDFINNMTHEFKTPVATIMIASEALKDPEVTEDSQRINRLANIIYDENVRLGNHIERVLNIAKIDKGDLKLEFKPVEMNDLISAIADSMTLQFQKRNASTRLDLGATRSVVKGDELHLSNIIFNLIDNALKYSKDNPEITISTLNSGKHLIIRVKDKGIGMNKDQLTKIFEQFYRIPTGNLHDVKGFGLGLSYVANIVKRHNGYVRVKSEKDKGSEFEVVLPTQDVHI